MNLRHLKLEREQRLKNGVFETWAWLDPEIDAKLDWKAASGPPAVMRRLLLYGQAAKTLLELRKIAPKIFLLTNDGLDTWPSPYDFGNLSQEALQKYVWRPVRRGFGDEGVFAMDTGFDNFVIESGDGTFADFIVEYLGGQMHPVRYWFCFAEKGTRISDIVEAVQSASNEEDLMARLCERTVVVSYGFEEDAYLFCTSRESIADTIRASLSHDTDAKKKKGAKRG